MKETEEYILNEINQLFINLEKATYGEYKANGHFIHPSANSFYYTLKKLYDYIDNLVNNYNPQYIYPSNYMFIYDSQRTILPRLNVLRNNKKLKGHELTNILQQYLEELNGVFTCIIEQIEKLNETSKK